MVCEQRRHSFLYCWAFDWVMQAEVHNRYGQQVQHCLPTLLAVEEAFAFADCAQVVGEPVVIQPNSAHVDGHWLNVHTALLLSVGY